MRVLDTGWKRGVVSELRFAPDGRALLAAELGFGGAGVVTWGLPAGDRLAPCPPPPDHLYAAWVAADGRVLAALAPADRDGRLAVADPPAAPRRWWRVRNEVPPAFDPGSGRLLGFAYGPAADFWPVTGLRGHRLDGTRTVAEWERPTAREWVLDWAAYAPDGSALVLLERPADFAGPRRLRWLDPATGADRGAAGSPLAEPKGLAVAGGTAVGFGGPSLQVWAVGAAKPRRVPTGGRAAVRGAAVHPSGRWAAAVCNDPAVRLFDAATGQPAAALSFAVGNLRSVAVSPDGLLAAAGSDTGRVVVWDWDL